MERKELMQKFANKLNQLMSQKGYGSSRSKAGIDINQLAKISDCSYQMARKYALGHALPEIPAILKIASWLDSSPNELLSYENSAPSAAYKNNLNQGPAVKIELDLLKYILNKSVRLFSLSKDSHEIINFIVDTVYEATHLAVDSQATYKIVDMMISSATLFNKTEQIDDK